MRSDYGDGLLPRRATLHSAGYDFYSPRDIDMSPHVWYDVDTGIHLEDGNIMWNQVMLLFPRSGLGNKAGLRLANTCGVIDSDYRDSIKARISVSVPYTLERGERFMQGVVVQYWLVDNEIPPTRERTGGLGSTGK